MLTLKGTVVSCNVTETKNKRTKLTQVQILANGGKFSSLIFVADWQNRSWPVGKVVEMPVTVRASAKNERAYLNFTAIEGD